MGHKTLTYNFPSFIVQRAQFPDDDSFDAIKELARNIEQLRNTIVEAVNHNADNTILPTYTVATVPAASSNTRRLVYISDEVGGAIPAFSDGTNWRRVTDRAIIS